MDHVDDTQNDTQDDSQADSPTGSGAAEDQGGGSPRRPPRRSRRATRPAGTPERPTLDVLAELGLGQPDDHPQDQPDDQAADDQATDDQAADDEAAAEDAGEDDGSAGSPADDVEALDTGLAAPEGGPAVEEDTVPGADDAITGGDDDAPRLPATALLFQAPDLTPRRRRRASAPAGPPEAAAEPATDETVDAAPTARHRAEEEADEEVPTAEPTTGDAAAAPETDGVADEEDGATPRRRRRRGGRGRRKGKNADQGEDTGRPDQQDDDEPSTGEPETGDAGTAGERGGEPDDPDESDAESDDGGGSRRRRRRRSRSGRDEGAKARDEVTALKGSTRLEAKRQRRREGRDSHRRRAIITEAEFLARRESVDRAMVVRERDGLTQIAVLEDDVLVEHYVARKTQTSMVGNVYLGRVQNVLPSMEAAFVDLGRGRNAVLYAGEVNWDAAGLEGQPRRIEQALSSGDSVLVQVTKDPIGHKGARLTSQITLAGRYLVLVPSGSMTGISRKLPDTERNRLKKLLKEIVPEGQGVIVRTAAEGASEEELRRDVERLTKTWADIDKKASKASTSAPALLKGEPELATRVVRDVFNEDFRSLTVQGDEAWKTISEYVGSVAPDLAERLHPWTAAEDVFASHRIDEQLAKAMDRKVYLPSGGSLVIDRTEAMTVVDVNTGKFTGSGGTLEETVTRNNLEAAEEIVRQLRLRDIGGIIVVDFIDMVLESNRDLVLRRLVECLGRDRTRHQVAEVTSLGLVQMTRKRVGQGLVEAFSTPCEHCHGRGIVLHTDPVESGGHGATEESEGPRSGRGGRRGRRGSGAATAATAAAAPAEPVADPAQRAQVRATLAAIAAAAAHAHEEQHLDEEGRPVGPPLTDGPLAAGELDTEELDTDELATDELATDELATDELATDELATDGLATDELATDGLATDELAGEDSSVVDDDLPTPQGDVVGVAFDGVVPEVSSGEVTDVADAEDAEDAQDSEPATGQQEAAQPSD